MTDEGTAAPLLHVGYHKTATTWLQHGPFADPAGPFAMPLSRAEILDLLVDVEPFCFEPAQVRAHVAAGLAQAHRAGKVPVVSFERFSGSPHTGAYDADVIAERLAAVFPGAPVFVCIREQTDMLVSAYKQYVSIGGALPIDRYVKRPSRHHVEGPWFSWTQFEYEHLIEGYRRLFGPERVLVLPYELLRNDALEFVTAITSFCGIAPVQAVDTQPRHASMSAAMIAVKRHLDRPLVKHALNPTGRVDHPDFNPWLRDKLRAADGMLPSRMRNWFDESLRRQAAALVGDRYRASNRATMALTGLDLGALGYPV